jgi:hypothetical protein
MIRVVGLAAHGLDDETAAENLRVFAHIVADDIRVVHPHVQADGALFLEVAPGGDGHGIVAAGAHLDHEKRIPQQTRVEHRPRQAVGRVAAVVFGGGQDGAAAAGRVDHGAAGAHGNAQGFFDQSVFARLQSRHRHLVVHGAVRDHVHRADVGMRQNLVQVGEDQGLVPEEALHLARPELGVLASYIAYRHQVDIADAAVLQHPVGHDVAVAHAATADDAERDLFHKSSSF